MTGDFQIQPVLAIRNISQFLAHLQSSENCVFVQIISASCEFCYSLQLMDSIAGSLDGVVEHMTEVCIFDIKSKLNTTSSDPQQQQGVVDEIVQQIEDVSCPGKPTVCSGHGTCKKGRCICDAGKLQLLCVCVCVCVCVRVGSAIAQGRRDALCQL